MAVTITAAQLAAAIRADAGNSAILAEVTRLLPVATAIVERYAPGAPEAVQNEAVVRLSGYSFDAPFNPAVGRTVTTNALQASGAAALLAQWRDHRGGVIAGAVAGRTASAAAAGNPVVGVSLTGSTLSFRFADGSDEDLTLPTGGGEGGGLTPEQAAELSTSIPVGGVSLEGDDLVFASHGGGSNTVDLLPAVEAVIAGMLTSNTETRIAVSLSGEAGARKLDFVVAVPPGPTEQQVFDHLKNILLEGAGIDLTDVDITRRITIASSVSNPVTLDTGAFTASDNGTFPAWKHGQGWVNSEFLDANGFTWTWDATVNYWVLNSDKLNQAEVDARADVRGAAQATARIAAEVVPEARKGQTGSVELAELVRAVVGGSWTDSAAQVASTFYDDEASIPAPAGLTYVPSFNVFPARANVWAVVRVVKDNAPQVQAGLFRTVSRGSLGGVADTETSENWTLLSSSGTTYDYYAASIERAALGEEFRVQRLTPLGFDRSKFGAGELIPSGGAVGDALTRAAASGLSWTTPAHGLGLFRSLLADHVQGITITSGAAAVRLTAQTVSPAVALRDVTHGLLLVSVEWSVSGAVGTFLLDGPLEASNIVQLSAIRAAPAITGSTANVGVKVLTIPIEGPSDSHEGDVVLYAVRETDDGAENLAWYLAYEVADGSSANYGTVSATISMTLLEADAPAAGGGGSSGPTYTELASAAVASNRTGFNFTATEAQALITAWNSGTYEAMLFEVQWGTSTAPQRAQAMAWIRETVPGGGSLRMHLPIEGGDLDGGAEEMYFDIQDVATKSASATSVHDNTFLANTTMKVYGVSR